MRFALACGTVLILAGASVFWWQRSQIAQLRAQVARQGDALGDLYARVGDEGQPSAPARGVTLASLRIQPARASREDGAAAMRAEERRIILAQYEDVLAQMDLPPDKSSRLLDLLTERIDTVLDAEDAAVRVGFAEGSAQAARAVSLAIAEVDRDIVGLVGADGMRRIDGLSAAPASAPPAAPEPAPPVIVNVIVQAPAPQVAYADSTPAPTPEDSTGAYYASYPYPYFPLYPMAAVLNEPRGNHRFAEPRNGVLPHRRESVRFTYR
jgi:hypothetical protein